MKKFNIRDITLIAIMAAIVFAASNIQFIIPIPIGTPPRLHLGNVSCLLGGIVLGGIPGGLAAGIGSAFFDLSNPLYITSAPFTFAFKFIMAFLCGWIAYSSNKEGLNFKHNTIGGIVGIAAYIILYLSHTFILNVYFYNMEVTAALINIGQKAFVSSINGIVAVVVAAPLGIAIKKSLLLMPKMRS